MGKKGQSLKVKVHRHKDKTKEIASLNQQLGLLDLKVVLVTADGNCFFRAVAEQLEGDEEQHARYRQMVVNYLQEHREEFEPFVEDEVPFDEYLKTMREETTWAGHMEIQATSLVTRTNICIHQLKTPRWQIRNFITADTTTIHLSYHDGEHYNSVRRQDDPGVGPAKPFIIEGDATPASQPPPVKDNIKDKSKVVEAATIKRIMGSSGCTNEKRVREILLDVHGDADTAIEYLIAEAGGDASSTGSDENDPGSSAATGDQNRISVSDDAESARSLSSHTASESGRIGNASSVSSQSVGRNKPCPCGSKKKYKSCCGTSKNRTTPAYMSRVEEPLSNRMRKQKVKMTKGLHHPSDEEVPRTADTLDMGAICL
ncbi:OVARIAN TUMOR DOMAIN-containing deubiquitinating enzyme 7 isoform X1 [Physcomitrium patens]|uniref:OTU domain-containing protein n=2 Tax=Physcomitrium patens TaxID=3218 RepID=A0A2K1L0W0_PHYPA|nr:OTU domain-containing protein 3-like isoform X1 [Physcomitrium patens]PNR59655.1 hypothetical protein PHYPA_002447 [Physcomitrium patens]|eukprot:XP_024402364.1 OTU domain-containing protein 3-like isoform X1 [Physcomitrella patens]